MDAKVADKINEFFNQFSTRQYSKGQILILSGDDTDYVYHIISGKVKEYDVSYRGDEIILNVFKPPAFFPMSLAINKVRNPFVYEADTDVSLKRAPADEVVAFIKANPDVLFDLMSRVYRGLDGLLNRMVHLMSSSARNRILYELIIEAKRFGETLANGKCEISLNEKDLGARAGLSRETVSREISKLRGEGMISIGGKKITIESVDLLEAKLGQQVLE